MSWIAEGSVTHNLLEREFVLQVDGHNVPGVYWSPADGADRLVLLGHGGTANKKADYIASVAKLLAREGIASVAIDGPGHGDRVAPWKPVPGKFEEMWHAGGGTQTVLSDWRATLDFCEAEFGARPAGWWGLSMGTMMGLPVTASDDRIKVALLGLMGTWGPNQEDLQSLAPQVQVPLRFLVQWDDEVVPRDKCLALFDLLGSQRKTMHVNPGLHSAVPMFEIRASVEYLSNHLK